MRFGQISKSRGSASGGISAGHAAGTTCVSCKVSRHTAHSAHPIKSKTSHTDMGHVAPPVSHVFHRLHGGIASQPWGTWRAAARPSRWRARRQHKSTSAVLARPPPSNPPHTPPKGGTGSHFAEANSGLGPRPAGSKGDRLTAIGGKEVTRAFHAGERARALELRAHRARRAARAAAPRRGAGGHLSPHSTGAHGTRATARGAQAREAGSFKCYSRVEIRSINPCFKC